MKSLSLFLIGLVLAVGCSTGCLKDGSSAVSTASITGGYQPSDGMWTVGVTLTFKEPPDQATENALLLAGAWRASSLVFVLPNYDRKEVGHNKAVELALKQGATLTGYKSP